MNKVEHLITDYVLVQDPGQAGYERIRRAIEEIEGKPRPAQKIRPVEDDLHPAWIVFGVLLIAVTYFWLFSVTA